MIFYDPFFKSRTKNLSPLPVPENGPIKINIIISNINAITAKAIIPTTKGAIFSINSNTNGIKQKEIINETKVYLLVLLL